ncbi:MAG: hypothetical protein ACR2MG_12200 [Pyrinomonadaceae bacterium]
MIMNPDMKYVNFLHPLTKTESYFSQRFISAKRSSLDFCSAASDRLRSEMVAGEIFIEGFSGGRLPPRDTIREIRINQNPFSSGYDRLGLGRIEILI